MMMRLSHPAGHAAVRSFTVRRLAANACQAITNDGRKHAVAMTLQTTVARPSSPARAIAGMVIGTAFPASAIGRSARERYSTLESLEEYIVQEVLGAKREHSSSKGKRIVR